MQTKYIELHKIRLEDARFFKMLAPMDVGLERSSTARAVSGTAEDFCQYNNCVPLAYYYMGVEGYTYDVVKGNTGACRVCPMVGPERLQGFTTVDIISKLNTIFPRGNRFRYLHISGGFSFANLKEILLNGLYGKLKLNSRETFVLVGTAADETSHAFNVFRLQDGQLYVFDGQTYYSHIRDPSNPYHTNNIITPFDDFISIGRYVRFHLPIVIENPVYVPGNDGEGVYTIENIVNELNLPGSGVEAPPSTADGRTAIWTQPYYQGFRNIRKLPLGTRVGPAPPQAPFGTGPFSFGTTPPQAPFGTRPFSFGPFGFGSAPPQTQTTHYPYNDSRSKDEREFRGIYGLTRTYPGYPWRRYYGY